jgi:hypothetical protein
MPSKILASRLKTTSATLVALVGSLLFVGVSSAFGAVGAAPGWEVISFAAPTDFSAGDFG